MLKNRTNRSAHLFAASLALSTLLSGGCALQGAVADGIYLAISEAVAATLTTAAESIIGSANQSE